MPGPAEGGMFALQRGEMHRVVTAFCWVRGGTAAGVAAASVAGAVAWMHSASPRVGAALHLAVKPLSCCCGVHVGVMCVLHHAVALPCTFVLLLLRRLTRWRDVYYCRLTLRSRPTAGT